MKSLFAKKHKNPNLYTEAYYEELRNRMVETQILKRGVKDEKVLQAMRKVPRHKFISHETLKTHPFAQYGELAYSDQPLPIGEGQTISQPYIVALMTECLGLDSADRVLEVGTGSGYQSAILAEIAAEVYSLEIVKPLADRASQLLEELGYKNVRVKNADGYEGWGEFAPYDAIMVTAAPKRIPQSLISQLKLGGKMAIPVGDYDQELILLIKKESGVEEKYITSVKFVPMKYECVKGGSNYS